jgi:iron complex outermembrane receptor protein
MKHQNKTVSVTVGAILAACAICTTAVAAEAQLPTSANHSSPATDSNAAQPAPSQSLQPIIVTAQRRRQNIEDVPISVTALSPKQLAQFQITSTQDLSRVVPNMFASNNVGQASANVYYIRGLGQTQSFPTFEPQVGTYVDGVYIARQNANNFALFGVQSVQVLNGPQGTLFGRNSTGGAIVVTLKPPRRHFGGTAELSYGQIGEGFVADQYTARASVNIPISQHVLTRTSFYGITDNGYVNDVTTHQRLNSTNNFGVREALRFLLTPNVQWTVSADYERNNAANVLNQPLANGTRVSYTGLSIIGGALKPYLTGKKSTFGQGVVVDSYGLSSHLRWSIGNGTLESITAYRGLHQQLAADFATPALGNLFIADAVPTGEITLAQDLSSHEISQELKWNDRIGARLNYTTGVFLFYDENGNNYGQVLGLSPTLALPLNDQYIWNDTTSIAAYAQGDYKITHALTLTVGGRITHEARSVTAFANQPNLGYDTAQIIAAGYATGLTANQFTPRVALQYRFNPDWMVFASATKGFQGGGWNGLTGSNPQDFNSFRPETVWSYEAGWRATPTSNFMFNTTLFYEDVKNDQLLYDNPRTGSFDSANAADMYGYGVEAQFEWQPIERLNIGGSASSMKAGFYHPASFILTQQAQCRAGVTSSCDQGIVRPNGSLATPVFTPAFSLSLNASYRLNFGTLEVTPFVAIHHVGSEWVDSANTMGTVAPYPGVGGANTARTLMTASITLADPSRFPVTITAECQNCTNVNYGTTDLLGLNYYNTPGSWDLRLNYKF